MQIEAKAELRVARPAAEVFEAIVDPAQMSRYFISEGSGRMEAGRHVVWTWGDVGAEGPVDVLEVEPGRRVSFSWGPEGGTKTRVDIKLEAEDADATAISITEGSWEADAAGIETMRGQTFGWAHFLLCLKAYLEFGIDLRAGSISRRLLEDIKQAQSSAAQH